MSIVLFIFDFFYNFWHLCLCISTFLLFLRFNSLDIKIVFVIIT